MYACDFEFDGLYLSDFGFVICNFDKGSGLETVSAGSKITFNTVSKNSGKKHSLTGTKYDECIESSFDICKDPSLHNDLMIKDAEYREITRWLNRRGFYKFSLIDDDNIEMEPRYYNASFNVEKHKVDDMLYGLRLSMTTDSPFGYGTERVSIFDINDIEKQYVLMDVSDEIGYLYPTVVITCKSEGTLTITNEKTNCTTEIKGCSVGEVITIDGDALLINSSSASHKICNDFNYEFLKIGNTFTDRVNRFTVNKPCKLEIRYSPIIKDSPN